MKNKQIILITFGMILLVALVTAQVLSVRDSNIELSKENKTILESYNLDSPQTTELICYGNEDICTYHIYQHQGYKQIYEKQDINGTVTYRQEAIIYNLGTHEINRSGKTSQQIETEQELQIKEWLGNYAGVLKDREPQTEEIILNKTQINIIEVKEK